LQQVDREREGKRLGGLILTVVGGALALALYQIVREVPVYLIGFIPAGIGLVLLGVSLTSRRLS
jgi:hypothetical protein